MYIRINIYIKEIKKITTHMIVKALTIWKTIKSGKTFCLHFVYVSIKSKHLQ